VLSVEKIGVEIRVERSVGSRNIAGAVANHEAVTVVAFIAVRRERHRPDPFPRRHLRVFSDPDADIVV